MIAAATIVCRAQWISPSDLQSPVPPISDITYHGALAALCPGHVINTKDFKGCEVCPKETSSPGESVKPSIQSILAGSFTGPGKYELLAVLYGCEPHASHYVDVFLFQTQGGRWTARKLEGPRGPCQILTNAQGQDGLLCYEADLFTGLGSGSLFFTYLEGATTPILSTVMMPAACSPPNGQPLVVNSDIEGLRLDGHNLTVKASCSRGRKVCRGNQDVATHTPRKYQLDFLFDGKTFQVTPSSGAALKSFDACSTLDLR